MWSIVLILEFLLFHSCYARSCESQLIATNSCSCEGYQRTYECTIVGEGATVWKGSAFNCPATNNEIVLLHNVNSTIQAGCNDGEITARIVRIQYSTFTSQLTINIHAEMIGQNITCAYDSGVKLSEIGSSTLINEEATVLSPPPNDVRLFEEGPNHLSFSWSKVSSNCSMLHYHIVASNCGHCPETTTNTTATCIGNYTQLMMNGVSCSFAVQTVVCGDRAGGVSMAVNVLWRDVNLTSPTRTTENETSTSGREVTQCLLISNSVMIVFGATVGAMGLLIILLSAIFILVTVKLARSKRTLQYELNLINRAKSTEQLAIYEEINVCDSLKSSSPSIDTGENTAYMSVSAVNASKRTIK